MYGIDCLSEVYIVLDRMIRFSEIIYKLSLLSDLLRRSFHPRELPYTDVTEKAQSRANARGADAEELHHDT